MGNKLIIIGNGFDLRATLASKFSDFFKSSEKPLVEEWIFRSNDEHLKDLSFLSLLLYNSFYRRNEFYENWDSGPIVRGTAEFKKAFGTAFGLQGSVEDWMDVEGFIKQVLTSRGLQQLIASFDDHFSKRNPYSDRICISPRDFIPEFFERSRSVKQYFSIKDFYSFFLEEIKLFERRFVDYLKSQIDTNPNYRENVSKILPCLITHGDQGLIINFNYTFVNPPISFRGINVHGTLNRGIIIGIDGQNLEKSELIPFTKTFRKLVSGDPSTALTGEYDEIVIYGHSLGQQDYSYFQSIFDYCQLYQNRTVVRFIYSDYFIEKNPSEPFSNPKNDHRVNMAQKLFGLLSEYGNTLDNQEHGKNMIHKMILEGRLKFELNNFNAEEPSPNK